MFAEPAFNELRELYPRLAAAGKSVTIIGNGSNLLVSDRGIRGTVICIGQAMSSVSVSGNVITAEAGALLSAVANRAAEYGLSGMECLAGIPGTIGGAVYMNAGAYGGEMKDVVTGVTVLKPDGNLVNYSGDEMDFSYRHSRMYDEDGIVVSVKFTLAPGDETEIRSRMAELAAKRRDKQPLNYPSAGSTFKRPEGYFAGKLIEDAGLRGYTVGGACVSEKHCGFVVNKGGATAEDVLRLIGDVQDEVMKDFGVRLEPEVRMIGEF